MDNLKAMLGRDDGSSKILLVRRHDHMIKPLLNDNISRKRAFSNGTVTIFILGSCLFTGYAYARIQQDEILRRLFYNRYANLITLFDEWTPGFERGLAKVAHTAASFDSTYVLWFLKTSKLAEWRAYRKLEGEIIEKTAQQGDELSQAILDLEK